MANEDSLGDHIYSNIMGPEPSYKWNYKPMYYGLIDG